MPDRRRHRGSHPRDGEGFSEEAWPTLRQATEDLAWLLARGYSGKASVKLVGDRYALRERQRSAIQRATVSDEVSRERQKREVRAVAGGRLLIDGYNVLLTVESALGGAVVLASRDGAFRDMASMKRHYKRVEQTSQALEAIGEYLAEAEVTEAHWLLDRPIANSGRLKKLMTALAEARSWPWRVDLVASPDRELAQSSQTIATADGWILDQGGAWFNLARHVIESSAPDAWIVDLSKPTEPSP